MSLTALQPSTSTHNMISSLEEVKSSGIALQASQLSLFKKIEKIVISVLREALASLALIGALSLCLVLELGFRIRTLGKSGFIAKVKTLLFTPSAMNDKHDLTTIFSFLSSRYKIHSHCLVVDSATSLQAYHLESHKGQKAKELVVIFCPNGVSCENPEWPYWAVKDNGGLTKVDGAAIDFLFFDYRGVGRSTGELSHLGQLVEDSQLVAKWSEHWAKERDLPMSSVTFHGYSLGGGGASSAAELYPEAHLRCTHTFSSWSKVALSVLNRTLGSTATWISSPLLYSLGGDQLSPTQSLLRREQKAIAENLSIGTAFIRHAKKDAIIDNESALALAPGLLSGPFADRYFYQSDDCTHVNLGELTPFKAHETEKLTATASLPPVVSLD